MIPVVNSRIDVMSNIASHEEINSVVVLDELARRVRKSRQAAQQAGAALLHHCLDAGDALNEAQARVSIPWKRWLKDNCSIPLAGGGLQPLSVRSAFVYQQLANHREKIEAAISQVGELSQRAALRLISKPKQAGKKEPEEEEETSAPENLVPAGTNLALSALKITSDEQVTAALRILTLDWFIRVMPPEWNSDIQKRLRGHILRKEQKRHPNTRLKNLRLVHSGDGLAKH